MGRIRVGVDLSLRLLLLDSSDYVHWNAVVFLAEMHLHRAPRFLVGKIANHAAVESNGRREPGNSTGGEKCRGASHAEADDAKWPYALEIALSGRDIGHHVIPVEIAQITAGMRDLVRRVSAFEIAHEAVEYSRCDRDVTKRCKPVADCSNMMIDAENFLHDHHSAFWRACRIGAVGAQRMLVGRGQSELLTQRCLPYFYRTKPWRFYRYLNAFASNSYERFRAA